MDPRPPPSPPGPAGNGRGPAAVAALALVATLLIVFCVAAARRRAGRFALGATRAVRSGLDGAPYRVHRGHADAQGAADLLAALNRRAVDLLRALRREYPPHGRGGGRPGEARRAAAVARLLARYNPDNLAENSPRDPGGDTAFSQDKGSIVAICLRARDRPATLHDLDTLTFVTLHEMAHIALDATDHPPEFWATFRFLLEAAEAAGVYASADFAAAPRMYCGLRVDYNPRFDPAVAAV